MITIPTEISVALIGVFSVFVSAVVSKSVAKITSEKELQKQRELWEHEKSVALDEQLAQMTSCVLNFLNFCNWSTYGELIEKIDIIRIKTTGRLACLLDELHSQVELTKAKTPEDAQQIKHILEEIVEEYRKTGCQEASSKHR